MLVDAERDARVERASARLEPGQAIVVRHESTGDLHCEVVVYFSPGFDRCCTELAARPCPAPPRSDTTLLTGDQSVLDSLS